MDKYDLCFAFDDSMTHKAKSPDGLDVYKNKRGGGADVTPLFRHYHPVEKNDLCLATCN